MDEREISLAEAQERLPELVDDAERGETLTITRHGKEVARLTPPEPNGSGGQSDVLSEEERARRRAAFRKYREGVALLNPKPITREEILGIIRESRDGSGDECVEDSP